jgi:D-alanyl-D-alanine carboxypeptidase/D-alanyl-D-alanine-endopeptidase (penicillin-binding protein 4)
VHGAVTTVKGDAPPRLVIQKESRQGDKAELIRVSGRIGARRPLVSRYVNVAHPAMYAGALFKEFLLREGVRVHGQVVPGKRPGSSKRIVTFEGLPLGMIVYWLNKFSNNFMAEQINLTLGAVLRGPPGTRAKGLSVIRRQLLSMGVNEGAFALAEASGLSRANRLSASALTRVLLTASRNFSYMHEFISSLSIGGVDGTLKDSFRDRRTKGLIRAKTGTLRGVNCLAGYAVCRSGRRIAFAALVNSRNEHTGLIDYSERIVRRIMDLRL